ncbi:hypothetical protein ELG97_15065 [Rhizobium leguminosarum]|uniref:hypothetical protein n=1 Tax=Rhizobium leguminosarum TaxID=384 RepID=UPI001031D481|nr:hypothetical protein [Rhizobium leguminosarum]TBE93136.1 hypothetical protein ELG97_15065 [Rhizobium leguminosarum]
MDDVGFQPLGRRISVGSSRKQANAAVPGWVPFVVEFISNALPRNQAGNWEHLHIGAYEISCELLVKLGCAIDNGTGAIPVAEPNLPDVIPRWDDVATLVIWVAAQSGYIGFRLFPGARSSPSAPLAPANIRAAHGCGPAYLADEAFPAIQSLGLILGGRWTEAAETVLWRDDPPEWGLDFKSDRRFLRACDLAVATVPKDIAEKIKQHAEIREEQIVEWLELAHSAPGISRNRDDALKSLRFWSEHILDGIFETHWRLADGWLSPSESQRGLRLRFDPLAISMRMAFAERYLPKYPHLWRS